MTIECGDHDCVVQVLDSDTHPDALVGCVLSGGFFAVRKWRVGSRVLVRRDHRGTRIVVDGNSAVIVNSISIVAEILR